MPARKKARTAVKKNAKKTPKKPTAKPPKMHGPRADLGKPIDGFFAKQPAALRPIAEQLRALIEATVPDATSSIKWGMPFYELDGKMLCAIGGHKSHVNLILTGAPDAFDDPDGKLSGVSKLGRHAKLTSVADIDRDRFRSWLLTSVAQARGKA
jgi:hypothetical protein